MGVLARVVEAVPLGELKLRLTFSDGLVRELDLDPVLQGGLLDELRQPETFVRLGVDAATGTIGWPNGVDLDPDVLHGDHLPASGLAAQLIREYRLRPTG